MNFVLWTMRRTGGTSLAMLLGSRHASRTLHEPFAYRRTFADLRGRFEESGILENEQLIGAFNLKHTYELVPWSLNRALLELFDSRGYFQIMLIRRNEVARMRSLALARITRAYGVEKANKIYPDIVSGKVALPPIDIRAGLRHCDNCREATRQVREVFQQRGWPVLYYEDFFGGTPADVERKLEDLLRKMSAAGVAVVDRPRSSEVSAARIEHGNQHSDRLFKYVPNMRFFGVLLRARIALSPFISIMRMARRLTWSNYQSTEESDRDDAENVKTNSRLERSRRTKGEDHWRGRPQRLK